MTDAEVILWSRLRRNAVKGHRFRRQHSTGAYFVDFACLSIRLIAEVDGATHCTDDETAYDARRDAYLRQRGFRALRFWNGEVYENLDSVLETIWNAASPSGALARATSAMLGEEKGGAIETWLIPETFRPCLSRRWPKRRTSRSVRSTLCCRR